MWYLIVIVNLISVNDLHVATSTQTINFNSQALCEKAKAKVESNNTRFLDKNGYSTKANLRVYASCVEKDGW